MGHKMLVVSIITMICAIGHIATPFRTMGHPRSALQERLALQKDERESILVLGGGIIGITTAYSLAIAFKEIARGGNSRFSIPQIIVVESSDKLCAGASGQATGGLGAFGVQPETADLARLSYNLNFEMARRFNGSKNYGFSHQTIYRVTPKGFNGIPSPSDSWGPAPPIPNPLSVLPRWVKSSEDWEVQILASAPDGAHMDPAKYCPFLAERIRELDVKVLLNSNVTSVKMDSISKRFSSVEIEESGVSSQTVRCSTIVLAAGPWSDRVFTQLFPDAKIKLPMNSTSSAGNHFRVRTPGWKPEDDQKGSEQVFFNNVLPGGTNLDITSFLGGELYVGGWGAIPEELPILATSVSPQHSQISEMIDVMKQLVQIDANNKPEILEAGRCYRPLANPNHPIITKVDWSLLGGDSDAPAPCTATFGESRHQCSPVVGGLFLNIAHFGDGMTLAAGSGKVVSELILGQRPSADISGLGLPVVRSIRKSSP